MKNFNREASSGGWKGGNKFGEKTSWNRGTDSRGFDRPQMHKAICAECGKGCEVPFKPNGSKPILCSFCFKKDGSFEPKRYGGMDSARPSFAEKQMFSVTCDKCHDACEVPFRPSGDRPVYCRPCMGKNDVPERRNEFPERKSVDSHAEQFKMLNAKLDTILKTLLGNE